MPDGRLVHVLVEGREGVERELALKKLAEMTALARSQGIALTKAKRQLDLLRGIAGFNAGRAELAKQVVRRAQEHAPGKLAECTSGLRADLERARQAVLAEV